MEDRSEHVPPANDRSFPYLVRAKCPEKGTSGTPSPIFHFALAPKLVNMRNPKGFQKMRLFLPTGFERVKGASRRDF